MKEIKTRISPSPTGMAHLGTAKTAIWSYLFAKHNNGKFCIRIEDTDRERHQPEAVEIFLNDLKWIGIEWDEFVPSQYANRKRHIAVANELVKKDKAYKCFSTKKEIAEAREKANSKSFKFKSPWRDVAESDHPNLPFSIRLKTPKEGIISVDDIIRGHVEIEAKEIEDLIIIRSDGVPIYNLAVAVDDHDMEISHVSRGEEHFVNTFKQKIIYEAMGWEVPQFAHLPLILAPAGQKGKLSKRHGAVGVGDYRAKGFLPEALFNYLLKLGWGHGNDEIISKKEAIEWFDFKDVSKAGGQFDIKKLEALNAHYIREKDDSELCELAIPFFEKHISRKFSEAEKKTLLLAIPDLKTRVKTLVEMAELGGFLFATFPMDSRAEKNLQKPIPIIESEEKITPQIALSDFVKTAENLEWTRDSLNDYFNSHAEKLNVKLGKLLQPLRALICFSTITPPLYEAMILLGKKECIKRLEKLNV